MKQRYIISAIFTLTVATLLIACSDDVAPFGEKNAQNSQLGIDKEKVTFDMNRSATVKVTATTGLNWEVLWSVGWINVSRTNGNGSSDITISTNDDNPDTTPRTSYVTIASKRYGLKKTIAVEQEGSYVVLSRNSLDVPTSGGSYSLTVESNVAWRITSNPYWIKASVTGAEHGNHAVTISAEANKNATERQGEIVISALPYGSYRYGINRSVKVLQTPTTLAVSQTELTTSPEEGSLSFNVTSNSVWTAISSASWCKLSPASSNGNGTVNVTVAENNERNNRTATITVTAGNVSRTVKITQSSASLSLDKYSIKFGPTADSQVVKVTSNTKWTATSNADWCVVTTTNNSITVSASANNTTSQRTATVTVKAGGKTETITVKQEAPTLSVVPSSLSFSPGSGYSKLTLTTNAEWTATSNASWCTLSTSSGIGSKDIDVNVTANNGTATRTATITIKAGGLTKTISVKQESPSLSLSLSELSFTPESGTKTFSITTNMAWTAVSNANWCTLNSASGTGNKSINVTVYTNNETTLRTATITVKAGNQTKTVTVTQDCFTLTVSPATIQLPLQEATNTLSINSNTTWSISGIPTQWCSVSRTSGTGNAAVTIKTTAATSSTKRQATLVVKAGNLERNVTLTQDGVTLNISPTELTFDKTGGTKTVTVTSNAVFTASYIATSWYSVSVSGSTLSVKVTANTTVSNRTATITVKAAGMTRNITVNQTAGTSFDMDDYSDDTNMN